LDTLCAESRGATPPRKGSFANDSSRFIPDGVQLCIYPDLAPPIRSAAAELVLRLATAEKTTDGSCNLILGRPRKTGSFQMA
jgi:hypothetical protein